MIRVLCQDLPVDHLRSLRVPGFFVFKGFPDLLRERHGCALRTFRRHSSITFAQRPGTVDLVVDSEVGRIESYHGFVSRECLFRPPLDELDVAQCLVREREIGKQAQSLFDAGFRDRKFPQREICLRRKAQEVAVSRILFQVYVTEFRRHRQVAGTKLRHGVVELLFSVHAGSSPQPCAERQTVLVPSA